MTVPVKLGILGCGYAAREIHAPRLAQLSTLFEVVGVADVNRAAALDISDRLGGVPCFNNIDELIEGSSCEALAILTPLHGEFARTALENDLDLFIEKPLCEEPDEAHLLAELWRDRDRVVMVGTMRRFDEGLALARRLLPQLGDLRWVRIHDYISDGPSPSSSDGNLQDAVLQERLRQAGIESQRSLNAVQTTLLMMVHDLSILDELIGVESCPYALASEDGWSITGQLQLQGNVPCGFAVAEFGVPHFPVLDQGLQLVGTDASMEVSFGDPNGRPSLTRVSLRGGKDLDIVTESPTVAAERNYRVWEVKTDIYDRQWRAFYTALDAREVPIGGADEAVTGVELAWQIGLQSTTPTP